MRRRLLFISNLFPDAGQPIRGLDNATLLHALLATGNFDIRVLALRSRLPFFGGTGPNLKPRPGDANLFPEFVPVRYLPKIGSRWNDALARRDLMKPFLRVAKDFQPDAVLASWLYPDGCAVAPLCREAGLPLTLITQGTDTHHYLNHPIRRRKILAAVNLSRAVICRSGDLARRLGDAGANSQKLHVIYNGIDTDTFFPGSRNQARRELEVPPDEPLLLFVGNLLPVKDPHFLIAAFADWQRRSRLAGLSPGRLVMIGDGPMRAGLEREITNRGLEKRVALKGRLPPSEVGRWMRAADLLCLSSRAEGFPNVILEAMACGLPVVSTRVGGIAEKVGGEANGWLVEPGILADYVTTLDRAWSQVSSKAPAPSPIDPSLTWQSVAARYAEII